MKLWRSSSSIIVLAVVGSAPGVLGQSMFSNCTDETHVECQSPADVSAAQTADGTSQVLESPAPLGPALPEQIKLTGSVIPPNALTNWGHHHRLRLFGWANGGYTGSSIGNGLLAVEPRPNRFGDEWVLNQAALVLERTLHEAWSWGFRAEFYMGADPALLHPLDGLGPSDNPRFSTDFRQAYFSFHAPILTEGGIDIKLGRQYTPLGYETTTSPYRPIYSEAYAFAYSQNGAATGAIATIHVDSKLDVVAGVTLGANSLFDFRGRAPSYIARGLYFADSNKRTKLVGTLYTGPQPILAAAGHVGKWQTEIEVQLIHDVNRRLTLVSETNFGWDSRDPANQFRTSTWVGTYAVAIIHAHRLLDVNSRAEWFGDRNGSRIGKPANYGEITLGLNAMPKRSVNFRPEVRWDGADNRVFGPASASLLQNHQWTYALEMLVKF